MESVRELLLSKGRVEYTLPYTKESVMFDANFLDFITKLQLESHPTARLQRHQQSDTLIALSAAMFHQAAGTATQGVKLALNSLQAGARIIRIFHQPNTLAALNIAGLAEIANSTSKLLDKSKQFVVVFILLDYDEAGDSRFRTPFLPGWSNVGLIRLIGAVPSKTRHSIACAIPTPSSEHLSTWMQYLRESAKFWSRKLKRAGAPTISPRLALDKTDRAIEAMTRIYRDMQSLTLANAASLSWLVNIAWGLNILFVPASWLLKHSHKDMITLLRNDIQWSRDATSAIKTATTYLNTEPLPHPIDLRTRGAWRVCPRCFNRNLVQISVEAHCTKGTWMCQFCDQGTTEMIDEYESVSTPVGEVPRLIPTVFVCDMLESISYGFEVNINYAGGAEHTLWSRVAALAHGLPVTCEYFWDPLNMFDNRFVQAVVKEISLRSRSKRDNEQALVDAFHRGRFPALLYWILYDDEQLRGEILKSALTP